MSRRTVISEWYAAIGRKGGKKRAEAMSKRQRSMRARRAANARWAKVHEAQRLAALEK